MFGTLGGPEIFLILVIALIVFGPRKLPEIGRSVGNMMNEFRRASNEFRRTVEEEVEADKHRALAAPVAPPVADPAADPGDAATPPEPLPGTIAVGAAEAAAEPGPEAPAAAAEAAPPSAEPPAADR
ncbi:MAG: twin-arginine translocase TatA/TatE family subunit [Vicinamibacteria bacterium]|nr:twin-arginine translocase TatA/TatE family subunit [Vicinamibacteria bacterium]